LVLNNNITVIILQSIHSFVIKEIREKVQKVRTKACVTSVPAGKGFQELDPLFAGDSPIISIQQSYITNTDCTP
jgi:hypothetical protein